MRPWLIGCEESGKVRDALIERGIPAVSCDLLPSRSNGGPHIQFDAAYDAAEALLAKHKETGE